MQLRRSCGMGSSVKGEREPPPCRGERCNVAFALFSLAVLGIARFQGKALGQG